MKTPARVLCAAAALAGWLLIAAAPAIAKPRVEMELATERGFSQSSTRQWYKLLTDRGIDGLQIRAKRAEDQVTIEEAGTKASPVYRVRGMLTERGTLVVPGGQFTLSDGPAIAKWLTELGENGIDGVTQKKAAFGLLPKQFEQLHTDLARPIDFPTKGIAPQKLVQTLTARLTTPLGMDAEAEKMLAADEPVRDELQGVSCGTALAAILRPAGLVLVPRKQPGREPQLLITSSRGVSESWPIGWPPKQPPDKTLPPLMQFLDVEISDVTVAEALEAVQGRLKAPLLYDHNGMARRKLNLDAKVAIPARRTYYKRVLEQVLAKAELKSELRVDEAGKPFIWISAMKD